MTVDEAQEWERHLREVEQRKSVVAAAIKESKPYAGLIAAAEQTVSDCETELCNAERLLRVFHANYPELGSMQRELEYTEKQLELVSARQLTVVEAIKSPKGDLAEHVAKAARTVRNQYNKEHKELDTAKSDLEASIKQFREDNPKLRELEEGVTSAKRALVAAQDRLKAINAAPYQQLNRPGVCTG